jgi:L-ribulose-5-phosphate 3-epimerase
MSNFKIGVMADSFKLPIREGLVKAKELGADGVQVKAVKGEICPSNLDAAARQELKGYIEGLGLALSALCGDLGGYGFQVAADNREKIEQSRQIVDLAADMGTSVVTTHIGVVPVENTDPVYGAMRDACKQLGDYAHERGVSFAIETGPEPGARLKSFLDDVGSKGMGVNMDPANLVMVIGEDPVESVRALSEYIVHTHAKDGEQLAPCDPFEVYGAFAVGGVEGLDFGKLFNELPLGEGKVPWDGYLAALKESGYQGYLTIEREVGDDPAGDIKKAIDFLKQRI